ncbi:beta-1,4-galactosyltransferase 3-like isoform X3 [Tamandua tetradactyla]|uniref:beta-1,4-galactosyltransferase 3-like isoform X3 n=1 Tax=Tamandua tetradactyla TaxID=48850 RepID=UPI0040540394
MHRKTELRMERRMAQQRELLLLFLGVQLLLMGALLFQNHCHHGFTSFLHFLIQDRPKVGEELPFLVQISSPGVPYQDVYTNLSQIHPVNIDGPLKVMMPDNLTMEKVIKKNPLVKLGGEYWPPDCWTQHHTAIVVPHYGQAQHLQHFLFHLHPFLQRQQLHYDIYVVNQVKNTAFNRGRLRNVGFWEAMKEEYWDCIFFHDVDLLPEDDRNLYICDTFPAHVSVAIDKFNYKLPYKGYLGGVFALRPIHYLRINAFPSTYWDQDGAGLWPPVESLEASLPVPDPPYMAARWHKLTGLQASLQGTAAPLYHPHRGHQLPCPRSLKAKLREHLESRMEPPRLGLQESPPIHPTESLIKEMFVLHVFSPLPSLIPIH